MFIKFSEDPSNSFEDALFTGLDCTQTERQTIRRNQVGVHNQSQGWRVVKVDKICDALIGYRCMECATVGHSLL